MLQRLRLITGLINFTYVGTHLLNHAVGLHSIEAAEAGALIFMGFWRQPLITAVLYSSLLTHLGLVLWALYQRRHLRIPRWEVTRIILGLCIPALLINHVFANRITYELTGVYDTYTRVVTALWVVNPLAGVGQLTLLVIAWTHGCLGIHYWLRTKRWHARWVPALRVAGLLTPTLAIVGYVEMGLAVQARAADSTWLAQAYAPLPPGADATLDLWRYTTHGVYLALIGLVFLARWVRAGIERKRKGALQLTYPNGRQVTIIPGTSVLEASQANGIPHASLCGGRGRCSTCRTRIGAGLEELPAPSTDEARVLRRVGAPANVRLACQLRPTGSLEVFPLLPTATNIVDSLRSLSQSHGQEQEIAILFSDLRSFTKFSENRLPYDIVFVLNQYFAAVGSAIERSGGYLDKFIGDGTMALFGLAGDPALGCRQALQAASRMAVALDEVNLLLNYELREPLRMGIGIHVGPVIIGEMGHGRARSLTAIGDPVNTASRLEPLNKEYGSQVVVSAEVAARAGLDLTRFRREAIAVRGREALMEIFVIDDAAELEPVLQRMPSARMSSAAR